MWADRWPQPIDALRPMALLCSQKILCVMEYCGYCVCCQYIRKKHVIHQMFYLTDLLTLVARCFIFARCFNFRSQIFYFFNHLPDDLRNITSARWFKKKFQPSLTLNIDEIPTHLCPRVGISSMTQECRYETWWNTYSLGHSNSWIPAWIPSNYFQ